MKLFKVISAIALGILLIFSLVRLQNNISVFGNKSVQVDFSVYYTAGQTLLANFPLYQNGLVLNPPIWDGLAHYVNSRYIYPPLAAVPFELLAAIMTYGTAKFFWMYFILACLLASIVITVKSLKLKLNYWHYAIVAIYVALYFPLMTALERGQIDSLNLLILVTAIGLVVKSKSNEIASGFLWAFATLIKLHIGIVILFFILRKQWKMLAGYAFGGLTIAVLTAAILGPGVLKDYLAVELPRIVKTGGDRDVPELKLPDSYFTNYYEKYSPGSTYGLEKSGQFYPGVHLSFAWNASLARFISMRIQDFNNNWQIPSSFFSLFLLALLLPLTHFLLKKIKSNGRELSPEKEYLYWYAILMVIMLLGPLTWTMNAVWLIPLVALAVGRNPWSSDKMAVTPWLILVIALLLAFVPDCMYLGLRDFASPSMACKALDSSKYIFAELLIIISIYFQIKDSDDKTDNMKIAEESSPVKSI